MKPNKTHLFIAASSVALFIVLGIQVNWIIRTAHIKEELFNEKANLVLSKTSEAVLADTGARNHIPLHIDSREEHRIDSLLQHYMDFYNIHIDYYFQLKPAPYFTGSQNGFVSQSYTDPAGSYKTCISNDGNEENALELKLVFPKKEQFILAEMGTPFITSVVLIIVVLIISWRTILSLLKEKKISEHTADFLNNMTHEFKTPLTNISLAGKMITKESNIKQEDKIKHYSGIILEENEKLRHQIEQVLSMTALEQGEIPLQKTVLDFHALILSTQKYMGIQLENEQGNFTVYLQAENSVIEGDKTHLTNALYNLVDNAIKYTKGKPDITIRTINNGSTLVVILTDNGIGIDKKYQKDVFTKFFRIPTGDVHNVKGFGLGLAYTKKIVDLHKGSITLESETGKGTIFTITLPNV